MSIMSESEYGPQESVINLNGPDGNAFNLMAYAKQWSKEMGIDSGPLLKEMMNGDYEHLLKVLDDTFGSMVTFIRN